MCVSNVAYWDILWLTYLLNRTCVGNNLSNSNVYISHSNSSNNDFRGNYYGLAKNSIKPIQFKCSIQTKRPPYDEQSYFHSETSHMCITIVLCISLISIKKSPIIHVGLTRKDFNYLPHFQSTVNLYPMLLVLEVPEEKPNILIF